MVIFRNQQSCILSKNQYDQSYGLDEVDLNLPIPKLLSYYYKTSSLLFLGCSLNKDRTMQVFRAVKNGMGDMDRFQHFSIEQTPETEQELIERNAYLLEFVITAIWFEKGAYDLVEGILRHLRNEVRYRRGGNDNFKSAPAIVNQNEINKSGLSISSWAKFKLSFFKSLSWFTN